MAVIIHAITGPLLEQIVTVNESIREGEVPDIFKISTAGPTNGIHREKQPLIKVAIRISKEPFLWNDVKFGDCGLEIDNRQKQNDFVCFLGLKTCIR